MRGGSWRRPCAGARGRCRWATTRGPCTTTPVRGGQKNRERIRAAALSLFRSSLASLSLRTCSVLTCIRSASCALHVLRPLCVASPRVAGTGRAWAKASSAEASSSEEGAVTRTSPSLPNPAWQYLRVAHAMMGRIPRRSTAKQGRVFLLVVHAQHLLRARGQKRRGVAALLLLRGHPHAELARRVLLAPPI